MEITAANFEADVIQASHETPVLIDFWAPWCGPCKSLTPILEKLETDYTGRFRLAKINSDDEQQLAAAFGIRSIPTCILMMGGKPVDGFMGALPEGQLRAFLDNHLPSLDELQSQEQADAAEALIESGDAQSALQQLQAALEANPANDDARFDLVKLLLQMGELEAAAAGLQPALAQIPQALRFTALAQWHDALKFAFDTQTNPWTPERLQTALSANKRDFEARYAFARTLFAMGDVEAAMDELLEIVMRDKAWNSEAARKTYVAILELLTPTKAKTADTGNKTAGGIELSGQSAAQLDPQAELVSRYRRRLSMALN